MKSFDFADNSFWDRLGRENKPVVLYGTGNGADKILDVMESRGVGADGVFASDGFVRGRYFRGMKVLSYKEAVNRFGEDMTILMAFGSDRPEVLQTAEMLDSKHDLVIPDVPLYGGELFDYGYFLRSTERIEEVGSSLADNESRMVLEDLVNFRLTGKLKYLKRTNTINKSYEELFPCRKIKSCFDGGAYKGDTLRVMLDVFPLIERVYAVEPDPGSFRKLSEFADSFEKVRVDLYNAALSDKNESVIFSSSSGRGAGVNGGSKRASRIETKTATIDSILCGSVVDLIKLDVEGDEEAALRGAEKTVTEHRPCLDVSLYHRTDDFLSIPEYVKRLYPGYELYFRRRKCIPMWDLDLFAVPEDIHLTKQ